MTEQTNDPLAEIDRARQAFMDCAQHLDAVKMRHYGEDEQDMGWCVLIRDLPGAWTPPLSASGAGLGGPSAHDAWDEGFEEGMTFRVEQVGPSGVPIDPPLNPYPESAGQTNDPLADLAPLILGLRVHAELTDVPAPTQRVMRHAAEALTAAVRASGAGLGGTTPNPKDLPRPDGLRWAVACGCDAHGDHMACTENPCQMYRGCVHPTGVEVTALTENEADRRSGQPLTNAQRRACIPAGLGGITREQIMRALAGVLGVSWTDQDIADQADAVLALRPDPFTLWVDTADLRADARTTEEN